MIPTLETERLILRPHRLSDFDSYVEMWADPDVVRFIMGKPSDRETTWARLLRHAGHWQHLGFGFFAIEEKATGAFVGEGGFMEAKRDLAPSIEGTLEAGWALMPTGQGWGYATEAMAAAIGWAEAQFSGQRMTCIIDPDNLPSIRVANRLGFEQLARTIYKDSNITIFERKPK